MNVCKTEICLSDFLLFSSEEALVYYVRQAAYGLTRLRWVRNEAGIHPLVTESCLNKQLSEHGEVHNYVHEPDSCLGLKPGRIRQRKTYVRPAGISGGLLPTMTAKRTPH